jgi:hypothetical protein
MRATIRFPGFDANDTRTVLRNAQLQAQDRRYEDFLIVDADAHHYENASWSEIFDYVEDAVTRQRLQAAAARGGGRPGLIPAQIGDQDVAGRIKVSQARRFETVDDNGLHPDVVLTRRYMEAMGIDHSIVLPTPMLNLSPHPQPEIEVAMARAYARWMSERLLSVDTKIHSMLYLPFNDPVASARMIEEFGDRPGVAGFMVTSCRQRPVHDDAYVPVYAALQELGKPIGFHAVYNWQDQSLQQLNRFMSVHALAFPFYNMIHLTNWIVNGIPERFPQLNVIWIESGLAWIPFMMDRLDHEYLMRSSEAPLLTKMPSEYIRDMYFTSQPMERTASMEHLEATFEKINATTQLLYSSDYPHWDFDLPSVIYDLPFLDEAGKRRILGENARALFGLKAV